MRLILILSIGLALVSCEENKGEDTSWEKEEVLVQLAEIKNELKDIKSELQELKNTGPKTNKNSLSLQLPKLSLGNEATKVAILEFSDFECPYCAKHHRETFPQLKEQYIDTGIVRYYTRDYPLSFHKNAVPAAIAAKCAGQQGKYWEMHHELFMNSRDLGDELYLQSATELGLDVSQFNTCRDNPDTKKLVNIDLTHGNRAGVNGTPRFYVGEVKGDKLINVIPLSGAQPFGAFAGAIESLRD